MESRKRNAVRMRPRRRSAAGPVARPVPCAIFTAIDGTLLHDRTFEAGANRETVQRLRATGVPVIPVSVMTLDELEPIARAIGLSTPMIIEAGGAIARWTAERWEVEPCGPPAEILLEVIREIEDRSGASLLVYSTLEESDARQISGREGRLLQQSLQRRFSEPFLIETGDPERVAAAAAAIGFSLRRGRRLYHLTRECDQGEAFVRVREEIGCQVAIGIGGSPVDAELLLRCDIAMAMPRSDGNIDRELLAQVPHAIPAPAPAPHGWTATVDQALQNLSRAKLRAHLA